MCPSTFRTTVRNQLRIDCSSGNEMTSVMYRVAGYCKQFNDSSLVVWDSSHHCVTLWFEKEKYLSFFELKGLNGSESEKQEH